MPRNIPEEHRPQDLSLSFYNGRSCWKKENEIVMHMPITAYVQTKPGF